MPAGQFVHISQFYETTLTAFILILTGVQILSFICNLHPKISNSSLQSYKDELEWQKNKEQHNQNEQQQNQPQNELEKSVTNYVQNEITNMQQTQQEQKKQKQQSNTKQQQLSPKKQKLFKLYKSYNHFMSEKMAILMPLLVLGILTQSTYVYSLAAFFFAFLCEVLIQVLEGENEKTGIMFIGSRLTLWLRILEVLIVMSIFISYWIVQQFNAT